MIILCSIDLKLIISLFHLICIFLLPFQGTRDPYPYQRRGGYPGEEEGFAAGRSRDTYAGAPEQGFAREEKQGQRHRNYSGSKGDQDELDERGRRKSGHRGSRERKGKPGFYVYLILIFIIVGLSFLWLHDCYFYHY